jgi:hypothetical protein
MARAQAAERGRAASREWAERQRRKMVEAVRGKAEAAWSLHFFFAGVQKLFLGRWSMCNMEFGLRLFLPLAFGFNWEYPMDWV